MMFQSLTLFKRTHQYLLNQAKLYLGRQSQLEQKLQTVLESIMVKEKDWTLATFSQGYLKVTDKN